MTAYYNEIEPYAADWLENLIAAGHIAHGIVDRRSIEDVRPDELLGFTQCHFFAGIGVWSFALRGAGWTDDKPVWTGSCPCQSFSASGKGKGFADERHLWPAWFHLIRQCRPSVIFGEQVENAINHGWIDLVQSDLEGEGYACGPVGFPSCGVGAPHIRSRLWFVAERLADADGTIAKQLARPGARSDEAKDARPCGQPYGCGYVSVMANTKKSECEQSGGSWSRRGGFTDKSAACGMAGAAIERPGPVNGFWRNADWIGCRDGKFRPVEPGTFPLAYGASARVGRLRAYGNAINKEAAQAVIEAYLEKSP